MHANAIRQPIVIPVFMDPAPVICEFIHYDVRGRLSPTGEGRMTRPPAVLVPLMLIYGAASLLHFIHNAVYLHAYPNLPLWVTSGGVLASWLVVAGTGVLGYVLYSRVSRVAGLIVIAAYAALG